MCVYYVLQIILFIMKNLLGNFKVKESSVNSVEFLNENEMQQIRGGVEVPRPSSRPREIFDETEQ
jgi:hypothetical protein